MEAKCFRIARSGCGNYDTPVSSGIPIKACPMMLTQGGSLQASGQSLATECKQWCDKNPVECEAAMRRFCASHEWAQEARAGDGRQGVGTPACACLDPETAPPWGRLTFPETQQLVRGSASTVKELTGADGDINWDCVWPPCFATNGSVLRPRAGASCPQPTFTCVNVDYDVHISDIAAGTDAVTVGGCSASGDGALGHGALPSFWLHMRLLARKYMVPIILALLLLCGLLVAAATLLIRRSRPPQDARTGRALLDATQALARARALVARHERGAAAAVARSALGPARAALQAPAASRGRGGPLEAATSAARRELDGRVRSTLRRVVGELRRLSATGHQ